MNPVRKFKKGFLSKRVDKYFLSGILIVAVVFADQVTKFLIQAHLKINKSIVVIDGFFNITHIRNTGGAFGILSGMGSPFFLIASSLALLIVILYLVKAPKDNIWLIVSLSLISGGAIGNMIDRIRFGEVIDFIDIFYKDFDWPAFNIADSSITIGVFILFLDMVFKRKEK